MHQLVNKYEKYTEIHMCRAPNQYPRPSRQHGQQPCPVTIHHHCHQFGALHKASIAQPP